MRILPLRSLSPSAGPPSTVMVKWSLVPGSPLSIALTVNVQGTPLLVQVPPKVVVLPEIRKVVHGDAANLFEGRAAEVRRVYESGTELIHLGHESIRDAPENCLYGIDCREVT